MIKTITSTFQALRAASTDVVLELANGKDIVQNIKIIRESGIFDLAFYQSQLKEPCANLSAAIVHYLSQGAAQNLDLHPLFDTFFYVNTNKDVDFSVQNPLIHFITVGGRQGRNPNPLFDVQFYISEYADVRRATINPLVHYINFGAAERRIPSPIFDPKKYRKKVQDAELKECLSNYYSVGKKIVFVRGRGKVKVQKSKILTRQLASDIAINKKASFLRRFKPKVLSKIGKVSLRTEFWSRLRRRDKVLTHFLSEGIAKRIFPFPSFELLYELKPRKQESLFQNFVGNKVQQFWTVFPRDLNNYQSLPVEFIPFAKQAAKANLSKEKYELFKELVRSLTIKKNVQGFMDKKNTIVLASHQANLSGAPLLLLQIAKTLAAEGWECLLFLERPGVLEEDFSKVAHVINFDEAQGREKKCGQYLSLLFNDIQFKKPKICLLNSLETGGYAKAMDDNGIKNISLVHELVDTYSTEFLTDVFSRSESIIFPAKYVQKFAETYAPGTVNPSKRMIIPNALLEPEFGQCDRAESRKLIREEIKAPGNSLIVLGCGSPEMRKGIDLFVMAARIILSRWKGSLGRFSSRPIHFVWVGADKIDPFSPHYYVDWDIKQSELDSNIHLLSSRKDLRTTFNGSDIFVLPSRKDPFPCVVHNAMAAELPVVGFDNAGGVPEMLAGGGSKIVPYGDILAFTQAIEDYLTNDEQRIKDGQSNVRLVEEKFKFGDYMSKIKTEIDKVIKSPAQS